MIIDFCNYILFDPKITKYHKNNTDPTPAPLPGPHPQPLSKGRGWLWEGIAAPTCTFIGC